MVGTYRQLMKIEEYDNIIKAAWNSFSKGIPSGLNIYDKDMTMQLSCLVHTREHLIFIQQLSPATMLHNTT